MYLFPFPIFFIVFFSHAQSLSVRNSLEHVQILAAFGLGISRPDTSQQPLDLQAGGGARAAIFTWTADE